MPQGISTSALAKIKNMEAKALFAELKFAGYIVRYDSKWLLTESGERFGGNYADHPKFGKYIVWPENLIIEKSLSTGKSLTATQIGERFQLSAKKINQLLKELGWLHKTEQGWQLTLHGARVGGEQKTHSDSESHYVLWHDSIVRNKRLKQTIIEFMGQDAELHSTDHSYSSFRQKFTAKHRTLDGHYVHSKGELLIDNWLYMNGIAHAYQRPLPIDDDIICDFYLPSANAYLQFWGNDSGPTSTNEQQRKANIYLHHQLLLIDIYPEDLSNLDEILPPKLKLVGIKAY